MAVYAPAPRRFTLEREELDAKLELLEQMCLGNFDEAETPGSLPSPGSPPSPRPSYFDIETGSWIENECQWALEEADAANRESVLYEEEDKDACMAQMYDPGFFSLPRTSVGEKPLPDTPRTPDTLRGVRIDGPISPLVSLDAIRPRDQERCDSPSTVASSRSSSTIKASMYSFHSGEDFVKPGPSRAWVTRPAHAKASEKSSKSSERKAFVKPGPSRAWVQRGAQAKQTPVPVPPVSVARSQPQHRAALAVSSSGMEMQALAGSRRVKARDPHPTVHTARPPSPPLLRSSAELIRPSLDSIRSTSSSSKRPRPALRLSTSVSSPSLRLLAESGSQSAHEAAPSLSYIREAPVDHDHSDPGPDLATREPAPDAYDGGNEEPRLSSRWSPDSIAARPVGYAAEAPSLAKGTKRDKLISFIARGHPGSLSKPPPPPACTLPPPPTPLPDPYRTSTHSLASSRPSVASSSAPSSPPYRSSLSASMSSQASFTSASSVMTPADHGEPYRAHSAAYTPEDDDDFYLPHIPPPPELPPSPPPEPTLPLPSPDTPSASFLVPRAQPSLLAKLRPRRAKKLVISGIDSADLREPARNDPDDAVRAEQEQRDRIGRVLRWCESFGEVRKMEQKEDGSLHVYWKQWEVADRVCRVQAKVYIRDVGRVGLAWHYIS